MGKRRGKRGVDEIKIIKIVIIIITITITIIIIIITIITIITTIIIITIVILIVTIIIINKNEGGEEVRGEERRAHRQGEGRGRPDGTATAQTPHRHSPFCWPDEAVAVAGGKGEQHLRRSASNCLAK
ncbi:unnamed protein product [Closterium sp. Yama58-4]|nr:unnamed protein product [Closterium sp. Yama58-4]